MIETITETKKATKIQAKAASTQVLPDIESSVDHKAPVKAKAKRQPARKRNVNTELDQPKGVIPSALIAHETTVAHEPIVKAIRQTTPGRIIAKATLILQTKMAQRFFRNQTGITGFSKRVTRIWSAAAADDPYADLYLFRIFDAIVQARRTLSTFKEQYGKLISDSEEGVRLELGESEQPLEFELQFATPYGYMSAYLLADYDKLARQILSAIRLGLMDMRAADALKEATSVIKTVLNTPNGWQNTSVTRADLALDNDKAKKAAQLMGKISPQIREGKIRAPHAPIIRKSKGVKDE